MGLTCNVSMSSSLLNALTTRFSTTLSTRLSSRIYAGVIGNRAGGNGARVVRGKESKKESLPDQKTRNDRRVRERENSASRQGKNHGGSRAFCPCGRYTDCKEYLWDGRPYEKGPCRMHPSKKTFRASRNRRQAVMYETLLWYGRELRERERGSRDFCLISHTNCCWLELAGCLLACFSFLHHKSCVTASDNNNNNTNNLPEHHARARV